MTEKLTPIREIRVSPQNGIHYGFRISVELSQTGIPVARIAFDEDPRHDIVVMPMFDAKFCIDGDGLNATLKWDRVTVPAPIAADAVES